MAGKILLEVVTPEKRLLSQEVEEAVPNVVSAVLKVVGGHSPDSPLKPDMC